MTRGWTFPLNTPVGDPENCMGFDADDCRCQPVLGRPDTFIVCNCPRHYDLYVPPLESGAPLKPVQLTVGAHYYENSLRDHVPGFMHSRCHCENIGPGRTDLDGDVFLVVARCPMHDPAGDTDYKGKLYPVTRTVMK
jgi:hypothetical protein